ncbi:hypothetical protein [Ornithinimicrobium tianjinense]|uniref:Uncharacterized protein n=1 Tax=Ornithinimicrobium tianjinense TaxID=1195761 RepID=A0A917F482_9MICO|nr:hypothetical protein [Ornithinimicrobium tianjinense]GGF41015.1 hypothetical protein GCM10011366_05890 [Ornithinimicrobium tianjinense]
MSHTTSRTVVRASAIYDLVIAAPFALPWTAVWAFGALGLAHDGLGLTGSLPSAADPFTVLFANLTGSLVVVWATVRTVRPDHVLGAADVLARLLFSLAMVAALVAGASPVVLGFLVPEVGWLVVQALALAGPLRAAGAPSRPSATSEPAPTLAP